MSIRGVPQLKKLLIRYSDIDGSSAGIRSFLSTHLIQFAREQPSIKIQTEIKRNSHPLIQGEYLEGEDRIICVKNMECSDKILEIMHSIRRTTGRPVKALKKRVITTTPTIQGYWNPDRVYNVQIKE